MKRFFSFLIAAVCLFGITSCIYVNSKIEGQSSLETVSASKTYPILKVGAFHGIKTMQGIETHYTQAGKPSIKVTTNIKDTSLLDIRVEDNELIVGYKPSVVSIGDNVTTKVEITGYDVQGFKALSASDLVIYPPYSTRGELELDASSGASITIANFKADRVSVEASSAANIIIENGEARELEADASSGADIKISKITASFVAAEASSGADINVKGTADRVSLEASSGADISASELKAKTGEAKASSGGDVETNIKQFTKSESSGGSVNNVGE